MANASISFQVGPVTSTIESNKDVTWLADFMQDFVEALGGPVDGTNQEKADWVVEQFRQRIVQTVTNHRRNQAANIARDTEPVSDFVD